MTTVPAVGATTTQETAAKSSVGKMDYNAFLRLLITQLKNQDPTKPMDSTQFVAQLATFSQVEQNISTNAKLDSLLTASSLTIADAVIGRPIASPDGSVIGIVDTVRITSDGPIATLTDGTELPLGNGVTVG